jgi:mxaJ protein
MFSRSLNSRGLLAVALSAAFPVLADDTQRLRVCAEPDNLPFSNAAHQGFENRLATLVSNEIGTEPDYVWLQQRKGSIENSLTVGQCDVVLGVPATMPSVTVTNPYYRSTYVFISRKDRSLAITSLTDPKLALLRIGIHIVGDDYAPPAVLLARRGLSANITGFSLFGKEGEPNPAARIIEAVKDRSIDIAIAWGPPAGYFTDDTLEIAPVSPAAFMSVPFVYDISAAVRIGNQKLRNQIDDILSRRCNDIRALLREYRVPLVKEGSSTCDSSQADSASLR